MSEWKEYNLGDGIEIFTGFPFKSRRYTDNESDVRLLRGDNIVHGKLRWEGVKRWPVSDDSIDTIYQLKAGDIVLAMDRPWIAAGLKYAVISAFDLPCFLVQRVACLRGTNNIRSSFLRYLIGNRDFTQHVLSVETGTAVPHISSNQIKEFAFLCPPLPKQKAIADVLSSLDDKIDLLHRQNQTLEALAETLFRQWFENLENEDTISQLIGIQNVYAFKSKDFMQSGTHGVIKIRNISGGVIDTVHTDYVNQDIALSIQERFKVVSGDILVAMTGAEIGKLGIVPETYKDYWLNQRVGLLKEKFEGAKYLAYLQLKSEFGQDYINNKATGSAQPNISGTGIEECNFPKLSPEKIKEYSLQIRELFEKIIFNMGQIHTLNELRDNLLPKLMSGEVRVTY